MLHSYRLCWIFEISTVGRRRIQQAVRSKEGEMVWDGELAFLAEEVTRQNLFSRSKAGWAEQVLDAGVMFCSEDATK